MKEKLDLETLLRDNPEAAKHADVMREALESLRKLRESGVRGGGYTLVEPYGPRSIGSVPKARNWRGIKRSSK